MTKEEFIEKAINITSKEDFGKLYDEIVKPIKNTEMTKSGAVTLKFLQTKPGELYSAKMIGESLGVGSRSVSGSMRKLVTDGYVEKSGSNPTVYKITNKGINYTFDNN